MIKELKAIFKAKKHLKTGKKVQTLCPINIYISLNTFQLKHNKLIMCFKLKTSKFKVFFNGYFFIYKYLGIVYNTSWLK